MFRPNFPSSPILTQIRVKYIRCSLECPPLPHTCLSPITIALTPAALPILTLAARCYGDYCHYEGTWSSHRSASKTGNAAPVTASTKHPVFEDKDEAKGVEHVVSYRSILKSRAEEKALSAWSPSTPSSQLGLNSSVRKGGCWGESHHLPTLTGSGEKDLQLLQQAKVKTNVCFCGDGKADGANARG